MPFAVSASPGGDRKGDEAIRRPAAALTSARRASRSSAPPSRKVGARRILHGAPRGEAGRETLRSSWRNSGSSARSGRDWLWRARAFAERGFQELIDGGFDSPPLVLLRCPAALCDEQLPGVGMVDRPEDVSRAFDVEVGLERLLCCEASTIARWLAWYSVLIRVHRSAMSGSSGAALRITSASAAMRSFPSRKSRELSPS